MPITPSDAVKAAFPDFAVNLNTKSMQDLMAAHNQALPWVKGILDADRVAVKNAAILNPQNGRQNTYGLVAFGLQVNPTGWQTDDGTVGELLKLWTKRMNDLFPPRTTFSPDQLIQMAVDLEATAARWEELQKKFSNSGELDGNDPQRIAQLVEGLKSGAANVRGLYEKWCGAPERVDLVEINFPPQNH
jgi:hypothetical protein